MDTISVSLTRRESFKSIPLVLGHHPAIHSISSICHKHIYILSFSQLCATMFKYIPLVTFLRINKLEIRSEPELLINVMVLYPVQSPLFFRKIVENERYRWPSWPGLAWSTKGAGDGLETLRPTLSVLSNPITKWLPVKVSARSRRLYRKRGTMNGLSRYLCKTCKWNPSKGVRHLSEGGIVYNLYMESLRYFCITCEWNHPKWVRQLSYICIYV